MFSRIKNILSFSIVRNTPLFAALTPGANVMPHMPVEIKALAPYAATYVAPYAAPVVTALANPLVGTAAYLAATVADRLSGRIGNANFVLSASTICFVASVMMEANKFSFAPLAVVSTLSPILATFGRPDSHYSIKEGAMVGGAILALGIAAAYTGYLPVLTAAHLAYVNQASIIAGGVSSVYYVGTALYNYGLSALYTSGRILEGSVKGLRNSITPTLIVPTLAKVADYAMSQPRTFLTGIASPFTPATVGYLCAATVISYMVHGAYKQLLAPSRAQVAQAAAQAAAQVADLRAALALARTGAIAQAQADANANEVQARAAAQNALTQAQTQVLQAAAQVAQAQAQALVDQALVQAPAQNAVAQILAPFVQAQAAAQAQVVNLTEARNQAQALVVDRTEARNQAQAALAQAPAQQAQPQANEQAQAALAQAQAALDEAQAALDEAQAAFDQAQAAIAPAEQARDQAQAAIAPAEQARDQALTATQAAARAQVQALAQPLLAQAQPQAAAQAAAQALAQALAQPQPQPLAAAQAALGLAQEDLARAQAEADFIAAHPISHAQEIEFAAIAALQSPATRVDIPASLAAGLLAQVGQAHAYAR